MKRRPSDAPIAQMSDAQFNAVRLELKRVTLGGKPERPELFSGVNSQQYARSMRHAELKDQIRMARKNQGQRHQDR